MQSRKELRARSIFFLGALIVSLPILAELTGRDRVRVDLGIPDLPGYATLLGDFHTHTVFSDGLVWPTVRVDEAWREGFDVLSITDHLEYLPHKEDMNIRFNRPYALALPMAREMRMELIRGAEITKKMPPGHLNAIFLRDVDPIFNEDYLQSARAAAAQGAFIFWNHPDFPGNRREGKIPWHEEHTTLLSEGLLHGIEVANGRDYYPEAHQWCLDKGLTMLGNSDIHNALDLDYAPMQGDRRPATLVFAEDRNQQGIKDALVAHRTAVWSGDNIYGAEQFLVPLFEGATQVVTPDLAIRGRGRVSVQIANSSVIPFTLQRVGNPAGLSVPEEIVLAAKGTSVFSVRGTEGAQPGNRDVILRYRATNLYLTPEDHPVVEIRLNVEFQPGQTR